MGKEFRERRYENTLSLHKTRYLQNFVKTLDTNLEESLPFAADSL